MPRLDLNTPLVDLSHNQSSLQSFSGGSDSRLDDQFDGINLSGEKKTLPCSLRLDSELFHVFIS